jgi:hypothetical protein
LIPFTPTFCQGNRELNYSIWISTLDNSNDSLLFTSKIDYIEYSDEIETHTYGFYKVSGDTVFLFQRYGEWDKDFPRDSEHREGKKLLKLLWQNNRLKMIFAHHSIYDKPITIFDSNYYFKQVKKGMH